MQPGLRGQPYNHHADLRCLPRQLVLRRTQPVCVPGPHAQPSSVQPASPLPVRCGVQVQVRARRPADPLVQSHGHRIRVPGVVDQGAARSASRRSCLQRVPRILHGRIQEAPIGSHCIRGKERRKYRGLASFCGRFVIACAAVLDPYSDKRRLVTRNQHGEACYEAVPHRIMPECR